MISWSQTISTAYSPKKTCPQKVPRQSPWSQLPWPPPWLEDKPVNGWAHPAEVHASTEPKQIVQQLTKIPATQAITRLFSTENSKCSYVKFPVKRHPPPCFWQLSASNRLDVFFLSCLKWADCGSQQITATEGEITTPYYNTEYPNKLACVGVFQWTLSRKISGSSSQRLNWKTVLIVLRTMWLCEMGKTKQRRWLVITD